MFNSTFVTAFSYVYLYFFEHPLAFWVLFLVPIVVVSVRLGLIERRLEANQDVVTELNIPVLVLGYLPVSSVLVSMCMLWRWALELYRGEVDLAGTW